MIKSTERDLYRGRDPRALPAYDTLDASRYLRIPENTIRAWLFGRRYPKRTGGSGWTKALVEAHLRRIERDERGIAVRLFPFTRRADSVTAEAPRIIAIDPAIAFGRPVIAGSRVPTVEVAERFKAGESPRELVEDFGRKE